MVRSRDIRWAWCGARDRWEMRAVFIRKCEEMRPHGSSEEGWEFNNRVDVDW